MVLVCLATRRPPWLRMIRLAFVCFKGCTTRTLESLRRCLDQRNATYLWCIKQWGRLDTIDPQVPQKRPNINFVRSPICFRADVPEIGWLATAQPTNVCKCVPPREIGTLFIKFPAPSHLAECSVEAKVWSARSQLRPFVIRRQTS